jgi:hypothetical protein
MLKAYLNRYGVARVVALAAAGAAFGLNPVDATAARRLDAPRPAEIRVVAGVQHLDDLEELFWLCDHAASAGRIGANERAICGAITESLQMQRFGGDFERMLDWWRANRVVEHQKLDREDGSNAAE